MSQRDTAPRRISGQKQNTFFGGAAILAVGILVVKLIGMFYKIPPGQYHWGAGEHRLYQRL